MVTFDQITVKLLDSSLAKITVKYVSFLASDLLDEEPEQEYDDMLPSEIGSYFTVEHRGIRTTKHCESTWWELEDTVFEDNQAKRFILLPDLVLGLSEANRYEAWLAALREKGRDSEVGDYLRMRSKISRK